MKKFGSFIRVLFCDMKIIWEGWKDETVAFGGC